MSFENLGLMPELLRAISQEGYETPTPVQAQAIPFILAGRDIIAGAQTGTGKTAAFTLPLLQRLVASSAQGSSRPKIRALIITPTRELAMQVEESVRTYGAHLALRSTAVFGGVGIGGQLKTLRAGVDVLVATPGRLLDHHQQGNLDFRHIEILVLDEADRMLDMGFIHDIKRVLALLPKTRQNLLFSATYSDEIHALASGLLKDPATVEVARRNQEAELVEHLIHPVDKDRKRDLLVHVINERSMNQVLIFSRTKHGANHLATWLVKQGIPCAPIHGDRSQNQRVKALSDFKACKIQALVATDIAARGLDIDQLPHVVNFDLPQVPEDYVHRAGRTGRAGSTGMAISLVSPDDNSMLRDIEKMLKKQLPKAMVPGYEVDPTKPMEPRPPQGGNRGNRSPARHHAPTGTKPGPHERGDNRRGTAPARHHNPAGIRVPGASVRPEDVYGSSAGPRGQRTSAPGSSSQGQGSQGRPAPRQEGRGEPRGDNRGDSRPRGQTHQQQQPHQSPQSGQGPQRPAVGGREAVAASDRAKAIRSAVNDLVRSGL